MFQVSFVIPVLDEEANIASLLDDLAKRFPGSERVVVDGGSVDCTVVLAMPRCHQLLLGERGRAAQMNLGGRVARGEHLCFLHADSRPQGSGETLLRCLADRPAWSFCRVRLSGTAWQFRVIEWFMNWRSRLTSVATGDQMLVVRRDVFAATDGFDPLPLMEDVAYCKRLRRMQPPRWLPLTVVTSSRRWEQRGVVRTVVQMWWLRLAYWWGASPAALWRQYYGGDHDRV